ncbi:MAG: radical SAM protein [Gemmataceae bacterium]
MPHVIFVPLTGFRVGEAELRELGVTSPGLADRGAAIARLPALGPLTLAGMTPPPWSCSYLDAPAETEALVDRLAEEKPDLVAVSALTASAEEAYRLGARLRQRGLRCVLGGLHATACPEEAAAHFDAVVAGEGEPVWRQVLEDALEGRLHGIYRPDQPFDLSSAPTPRYDLLGGRRPRFTVQTQRGCPLACEFCGASRLLGAFREKPVERLREELAALAALGPRPVVELADDNTFAGARDPGPLLEVLGRSGARYFTEADWRVGERPDVLRGLSSSGCVQVLVGLESLVFRHPGMGAKQAELSRMIDACLAIQEAGVAVLACFIVGADGETRASLERLTAFLLECPLADVQVTLQTPFPGTGLYRRLAKAGRLLPGRGWSHYTLFDVTYRPDAMTVPELERGFREVLAAVFAKGPSERRGRSAGRRGRGSP